MKKTLKLMSMLFMMLLITVPFSSCSDDDDTSIDPANAVSGIYSGIMRPMGYSDEERAFVTITKMSKDAARVDIECNALHINISEIMDIKQNENGSYSLSIENKAVTGNITGKSIVLTFGYADITFNFIGSKE